MEAIAIQVNRTQMQTGSISNTATLSMIIDKVYNSAEKNKLCDKQQTLTSIYGIKIKVWLFEPRE